MSNSTKMSTMSKFQRLGIKMERQIKKKIFLEIRWRKFVSQCSGTIVSSYFKKNKPRNCHYTPRCCLFFLEQTRKCYFKDKKTKNKKTKRQKTKRQKDKKQKGQKDKKLPLYSPLLLSLHRTNPEMLFQSEISFWSRLIKLHKIHNMQNFHKNDKTPILLLEKEKTYFLKYLLEFQFVVSVNCNYIVIANKCRISCLLISILLGNSQRCQSLEIYYKANLNIVHEMKFLLSFEYFKNATAIFPIHSTHMPIYRLSITFRLFIAHPNLCR